MINAVRVVFHCGEIRLTSMWSFSVSKKLKKLPGSETSASSSSSSGCALVKLWASSSQLIFIAYEAEEGKQFVAIDSHASQYLRFDVQVPAEGSLGIGYTVLVLDPTINFRHGGVPIFLL